MGGDYVEQPLVEGVEQFQLEYGVDTDGDSNVDTICDCDRN